MGTAFFYWRFKLLPPHLIVTLKAGNPLPKGRISTVELLVLNSLEQQALLTFFYKKANSMRRSTVLGSFPFSEGFPLKVIKQKKRKLSQNFPKWKNFFGPFFSVSKE